MTKTNIPEISCRKPSATSAPNLWAKTAVDVNRKMFTATAIRMADMKRTHLLMGRKETI